MAIESHELDFLIFKNMERKNLQHFSNPHQLGKTKWCSNWIIAIIELFCTQASLTIQKTRLSSFQFQIWTTSVGGLECCVFWPANRWFAHLLHTICWLKSCRFHKLVQANAKFVRSFLWCKSLAFVWGIWLQTKIDYNQS